MRRRMVQFVALLAVCAALLSCGLRWFAIPVGAESLSASPTAIHIEEPRVTVVFRLLTVIALAVLAISWLLGRTGSWGLVAASIWLPGLLMYPYAVMNWEPSVAGDAAWLEAQHRNLVWSGGDLNLSLGHRIEGVFDRVLLTQPPRSVSPVDLGEWQPSELSLARLPDLFDRLGYANKFFEFIRPGWIAALAGCLLLLAAIGAAEGHADLGRLLRITAIASTTTIVLCLAAWAWSFAAAADLARAAQSTACGQYENALQSMEQARRKIPVLAEDTYFIAQTGLLENALGRNTPQVRLYRAGLDELAGKRYQSDMAYERLVSDVDVPPACRREACRGLLRSAIDALNSGRSNAAAALLEKVLAAEPCNLKANYALQFACLRTGRFQEVTSLTHRLEAVYHYFQFPSKLALVSASYQNSVVANAALGNTKVAVADERKVAKP